MSLLKYLKKTDNLPNPVGTLSDSIAPNAIKKANDEVKKIVEKSATPSRGKYKTYSSEDRALIGKHALENGPASAVKKFIHKFPGLNECTVRGFRAKYEKELVRKERKLDFDDTESSTDITELQPKKRGRKLLLGEKLDQQIIDYVKILRQRGAVVNTAIVRAAARGIILSTDPQMLSENGGSVTLTKNWAQSLLARINFVKRKGGTTKKSSVTDDEFKIREEDFLKRIFNSVSSNNIPPSLIINWDHTGLHVVPVSSWTMDEKGSKNVAVVGLDDKRQFTAVFAGSLAGDFLPVQVIYQGKTSACHPNFAFPKSWNITHSPNHWANSDTQMEYAEKIIFPYISQKKKQLGLPKDQKSLCLFDVFRGQMSDEFLGKLKKNNIDIIFVPANCTDRLQPLDLSVQKSVKDKLKCKFQSWYADQITKQVRGKSDSDWEPVHLHLSIMKPLGAKWLVELWDEIAATPSIIMNGFHKAGIIKTLEDELPLDIAALY